MKRKFILLMMMCLLGLFNSPLRAQEDVATINGDATSYSNIYPIAFGYNYSLSQTTYTSAEINHAAGTIDRIAFKVNLTANRNVSFYLQNTTAETMSGWMSYSGSDLVYSNTSLNTAPDGDGWLTIDIEDFDYQGGNLLLIASNNSGTTVSSYGAGCAYLGNAGRNATVYQTSTYNPIDITSTSAYTSSRQPALKLIFAQSDDIVPATPTNFKATADDHNSITLTWDAAENAKKYEIYFAGDKIGETTSTSYVVEGLKAETEYCYTIKSVRYSNYSEESDYACATTETAPDITYYRVKIVDGGSGVYGIGNYLHIKSYTMSNSNTSNVGVASKSNNDTQLFSLEDAGNGNYYLRSAQGYYIECGAYNTWNVDAYQTTPNTPLTFEYVGETNNFYIRNYKVSGTSNYFKSQDSGVYCDAPKDQYQVAIWTLEVDINDNIIPAAPVNLVATAIDHKSISLTWEAGDAYAISYNIYQNGVKIGTSMGTSYTVDNLPDAETQYCFTVKAVRGENESEASDSACATTAAAPKIRTIVFVLGDPGYGDGWNGNKLIVSYEDYYEELTLPSGKTITYEREIPQGVEVTLTYKLGGTYTYPYENSFEIKYADNDEVIWSKGEGELSATISHTFTVESLEPSVTVDITTIALGDVRMGEYWSEKDQKSAQFDVVVKNTTITNVSCDNDFFVVEYDANESVVNVSYNPESKVTGVQSGIITITSEDCDPVTVTVTANAYTAIAPDAIEAYTTIEFTDGTYTDTPTNLHDDYILPDEETDGNAPDAVYKFTLEEAAVVTVNVEGTNGIATIYKAEDLEGNGPSSDNNYEGYVPEVAASTTFGPYTFDDASEIDNFTFESGWSVINHNGSDQLYGNAVSRIVTKNKYAITANSKLLFDLSSWYATVATCISENGVDFTYITNYSSNGSWTENLSAYSGKEVYIGFEILVAGQGILIDNLKLTDGGKSRSTTPQIDAVQYEDGAYYLVAAAESEFTMTLSLSELVAPEAVAYTAPEDNAMNMDNPKLIWTFGKYTEEYQVMFGTDAENLDVVVDWTSSLATEYQTTDLEIATKYYWQVNAKNKVGTTNGAVRSFVSALPAPTNLTTEYEDYIFVEGESNIVLIWDAVEGVTYKVYKRGVYNNQTGWEYELLGTTENNSYEIESVYDEDGSKYAVSAVYEGDFESEKTLTDYIYVTGYGNIKGTITDGTNPIAGLTFEISGESAFGEDIYIIETDENGEFNEAVLEGIYTITISHYDYEEYVKDGVICVYDTENDRGEIVLTAKPEAEGVVVTATVGGDNANVTWTGDYTKYNVYRMSLDSYPQEAELVAEGVTENEYQDTDWATLDEGTYQYGVSTFVEEQQSRDVEVIFEEGFNENQFGPIGWSLYGNGGYTSSYSYVYSGAYGCYLGGSLGTATLTSPDINLTEHNGNITLKFYNFNGKYASGVTTNIKVKKTSENDWTILRTITETHEQFTLIEVDMSNYGGEAIKLQFEAQSTGYGYSCVDEISIVSESSAKETKPVWSNVLEKKADFVFNNAVGDNNWHNPENWAGEECPGSGDNVVLNAKAVITENVEVNNLSTGTYQLVINSGIFKVNGQLNVNQNAQLDSYYLVINDGAQLLQNNDGIPATFKMNIRTPETWNEGSDGWQFISMPFIDANISMFTSTTYHDENWQQHDTDYALFKYDGNADDEWDNIKENNNLFELQFVSGRGYLASQQHKDVATLEGTLNNASIHTWELTYNAEKDLANFHLLGNPFSFDMDWSKMTLNNIYDGFAYVNEEGGYSYGKDNEDNIIKVGDGFFVLATAEEPSLSYGAAKRGNAKSESINLIATSNAGKDNLIISLDGAEDKGFNKLDNFNKEIAEIYISDNGSRYAIMSFDQDVTEIPVNFDAKQMGNYTINAIANGKFSSVILLDRFTGIETNLLLESYSFTSSSDENHDRFIVKMVNGQQSTDNSHFAYQSGEDLILNIEGKVQIIDMMGRVVYANDVTSDNNRINVSELNNAAYIVRVVNEGGVKTQKLIVYSL